MGDDRLGPDTFSTRDLPTGRRGYEKKAVEALVARAIEEWGDLERRHADLLAEVARSGGPEHLARDVTAVGADVARILESAKEAAEGMRARAREDAERQEREAAAEAAKAREQATDEAERLVAEAQQQAFDLRRDAWEAADDVIRSVQEAEAAILADADAQALVIRADAEREAHQRLAIARKEADDIVRNGRYEGDRLVTQARELAQQMIDRARGVEGGDGSDRATAEEIERLHAERSIEGVAVLPAEPRPRRRRAAAEFRELDPQSVDLSDELAAEVEQLNDTPAPEPPPPPPPATGDDVGTLFEALRTTSEPDWGYADLPRDPAALRDRLALPIHNEGLREAKRRIVDLQSAALESLDDWAPDTASIAAELAAGLETAIQKAAGAGASAAAVLAGVQGARPRPGARPTSLVGDMALDLSVQLEDALGASGGPAEVASVVSRVFRAWRGDEAERWVRTIVFAAYHDSLLAALGAGGWTEVTGVSSGRLCAGCAGHDQLRWDPQAGPADGFAVPPANVDCLCTVTVPA